MSKKKATKRDNGSMTGTLTMTGKFAFRLQFILPAMAGMLSVLAVFNATNHSESPYLFTGAQVCWFLVGACLLAATAYPIDEHVRWVPVTGSIALAIIYASVFVPGISPPGQPGTIQLSWTGKISLQPAVFFSPIYLLWLVRYLPLAKHGADVSWKRFSIYLCQCMLWWLPLMIIPQKALLVGAIVTFVAVYWIEGGDFKKALSGGLVCSLVLTILLTTVNWMPDRYRTAQRVKDQWVVSMTLSQVSAFATTDTMVRAQDPLPLGDDNAVFLSMLESVGFVGAGLFLAIAGLIGWHAVRRAIDAETSVTTTVTIAAWLWISSRSLTYLVTLLGWPPGVGVPCPVFNANGNDLIAVMLILSGGLYKGSQPVAIQQS